MRRALTYAVAVLVTAVATLFFGAAPAQAYAPRLFSHKCAVAASDGTMEGVVCTQLWYAQFSGTVYDFWAVGQAICQPAGSTGATPVQCAGFTGTVRLVDYYYGFEQGMACGNYFGYAACPANSRFIRQGQIARVDLGYRCGENKKVTAALDEIRFRLPGSGKIVEWGRWESNSIYVPICAEPPFEW